MDTLYFVPAVSEYNPIAFKIEIANATTTRIIEGIVTYDTDVEPSVECTPLNTAPDFRIFPRGMFVAKFNYPNILD